MIQNTNENTNWQELFSLYRNLVGPFKEFEKRSKYKWELEQTLEREPALAKSPISFNFTGTIRDIFSDTLIWAIPFLIVFWVIMNVVQVNGEKLLMDMYTELLDPVHEAIYAQLSDMVLIGILVELLVLFVLFPLLALLFPFMIVRNVISEMRHISQRKKKNEETLKTCEKIRRELLPQAEAAVRDAREKIAPYVEKIPKDYRNSSALAFFSNSFFNSKVKNLQEAVNLYDQYLYRQRMEQSQREIAEAQRKAQRESMDAIDALSRQMDHLQDQIDSQEPVVNNNYYY